MYCVVLISCTLELTHVKEEMLMKAEEDANIQIQQGVCSFM
jgi:hypothetical protein